MKRTKQFQLLLIFITILISCKNETTTKKDSDIILDENINYKDLLSKRRAPFFKIHSDINKIFSNSVDLEKKYFDSIYIVYKNNILENEQICRNFIKEFPYSNTSAKTLNTFKTTWEKDTIVNLFKLFPKEIKESKNGKSIARFIEISKNPQIGEKYIDFEQQNINGKKVKLSNIKAKYTLVEFWASWCGPCRQSNPSLLDNYKRFNDKGFEILGVSLDNNKEKWLNAVKEDKLIWENVSDLNGSENEAGLIYRINGIPDNILINEKGIIIGRKLRGEDLKNKLKELFEEKASL
jgi:thiol-disulfide isomerase/thioredoxin